MVAWRALTSYPRGHPTVGEALARAHATLEGVVAAAGPVELGAARDALLWADRKLATTPAVQLARLLRRRRAAALYLDPGSTVEELEAFLRALAVDARAARDAGPFSQELAENGILHVRVADVDLSSLALVEAGDEDTSAPEAGAFASRVVRALLASGVLASEQVGKWTGSGKSHADLLQLLFETGGSGGTAGSARAAAFAAALRAIAAVLCEAPDADRAAAVAAIHARLAEADRGRLLQEIGAAAQGERGRRAEELLAALLPPDAAAELRRAAAAAAGDGRGPGEVPEAPTKVHAGQLSALRRAFATEDVDAFRDTQATIEELAALLEAPGDDPEPDLSPAASSIAAELGAPATASLAAWVELAERPELPAGDLPPILARVEAGYLQLLSAGRVREAARLVDRFRRRAAAPGPSAVSFRDAVSGMSSRRAMEALASALPELRDEALAAAPALVGGLDPVAVRHLLDVLADAGERKQRLRLLDLLCRLGPAVVGPAEAGLADPRWYVVRNMLLLLRRVGDARSLPAVRTSADHPDLRVRLEAIHCLFAFERTAPEELLGRAINDPDVRQAAAAVELAGQYRITEAVGPLVACLAARDPFGKRRPVRLAAIRALAAIGDPAALDGLVHFRARVPILRPAVEERRELYRTLAAYPEGARRPWIESGMRSGDGEIRRQSALLASGTGGAA
jgi:hypothetical protein